MKTRLGRYWPVIIVTLAALVLPLTVLAQSDGTPRPAPVVLTGSQGEYPLGLHLELLEDPIGELTIEEVVSPEYDDQKSLYYMWVGTVRYRNCVKNCYVIAVNRIPSVETVALCSHSPANSWRIKCRLESITGYVRNTASYPN